MAISKPLPDSYVPAFKMVVDNKPLEPDIAKTILEVSVTEQLNPPSQFSFRLNDPKLKFIKKEDGRFTEGKRVEISIGYIGNTKKMIVGEIAALMADFPSSGPAALQVEGFDLLHRATRGTTYRQFEEGKPDSDIVKEIAQNDMKLTASVDQTKRRTGRRVQNHVTNLKFLEDLARANGYFLWVDGDILYFKKERPAPNTIQLEWGKTLMSLSPRLSTAGQVNAVEVRGWDPVQKQSFSARVKLSGATAELAQAGQKQVSKGAGGRSERVIVCDASVSSAQEAQAFAEGMLAEQQRGLITGNGTSVGHPDIRAGTILDLRGIGRFSRKYVVEQVTHTVSDSGYQTSFQVRQQS